MIKFLTGFTFCLLVGLHVFAQSSNGSFYVTGKAKVDQGVIDGTHLELFRDGSKVQDLVINRTGNFRVSIELNYVYRFLFINNSYYPKTIEFDTHIPPEICNKDCIFPPYELALILYKKVAGVSEMDQPPARISYNKKMDVFDPDILRDEVDIKKMIDEALADAKEKSSLYDQKKIVDKKLKYDQLIKDADSQFRTGNLDQAMKTYRDAAMIMPSEKYPRDRVDQAYRLLVTAELQKSFGNPSEDNFMKYLNYGDKKIAEREYTMALIAYESAQAIHPEDQSIRSKISQTDVEVKAIKDLSWNEINHRKETYAARTLKYNELIALGNEQLKKENVLEAKDLYAQAATQIDENSYSLLMLQKIGEIISNENLAQKFNRERQEADQKRLANARNQAYSDAIAEADRLLDQRLYLDAIEYYELALTIKEYELYPKKQINTIKDIIAKLQLNGEEYNRLIRDADLWMQQKKYSEAKDNFLKAHQLILSEKYALQKIAEIDKLIKQQADEIIINEQYNQAITNADVFYNQNKYPEAIDAYQKASNIKPAEKYPKEQILKIRGILSRENDNQKLLLQKQTEYDQLINQADDEFSKQSYKNARSLYLRALQIFPGQEYPSSQVKKIDELLKLISTNTATSKSKLNEIDFANLQSLTQEERDAAFQEAMAMGEAFMNSKEWGVARFYFRRALSLIPNHPKATEKLNEADKMLRGSDINESKYSEFVKKADESFKTGDISVAKFYYAKALEIKPNDSYAKDRFNIAEQLLQSTITSAGDRDFNDAIAKGNEAYSIRNYSLARFFYRKALSLKPGNSTAAEKLKQSEKAIEQEKNNASNSEYDRYIQLGGQALQQNNYGSAINYYKQALNIKPNDQFAKDQLEKINQLHKK